MKRSPQQQEDLEMWDQFLIQKMMLILIWYW